MSVQVLCTRIAFTASFVLTLKLLVRVRFDNSPLLFGWLHGGILDLLLRNLSIVGGAILYTRVLFSFIFGLRVGHTDDSLLPKALQRLLDGAWQFGVRDIMGYSTSLIETRGRRRILWLDLSRRPCVLLSLSQTLAIQLREASALKQEWCSRQESQLVRWTWASSR